MKSDAYIGRKQQLAIAATSQFANAVVENSIGRSMEMAKSQTSCPDHDSCFSNDSYR